MSRLRRFLKGALAGGASVATLAALKAASAQKASDGETSPPPELAGELREFAWTHGRISYRVAGDEKSPPLVFIHGVGTGASGFMWRRNFSELSGAFRVFAPDLLGFGDSEKPPAAPYSAALYISLIRDFISETAQNAPAHLVAIGLGAAYATRVADEQPERVSALTLVSPRLLEAANSRSGAENATFYDLLNSPSLGASFYNAMANKRSIRDFARRQLFYDKRLAAPELVAQFYAASHQPNAQFVIAAYAAGRLNADVSESFARLPQTVSLVWGKQCPMPPLTQAATLLQLNPRAHLEIFDRARNWAHYERAQEFNRLLQNPLTARFC